MWRTARKNALAHKLRLALTAFAVVLGVAFMAGTLVLTATMKHGVDTAFAQSNSGYNVVVRATTPYSTTGSSAGTEGFITSRPLTPQSVVSAVRATPGVTAAGGVVEGQVALVSATGKTVKTKGGAPPVAFGWVPDPKLSQFNLRSGRVPQNNGQMLIDANTAKIDHLGIGSVLTVITDQAPEKSTVVGTFGFGSSATIGGGILVAFDTATAQHLVGKPGYFQQIDVGATPGTSTATLVNAIDARLPHGYQAVSSSAASQEQASDVNTFVSQLSTLLLAFALIALFVGAFLIFNTFNILVGQRTKELALYRALGASRRQVTGSVVLEALITGLVGSIAGLATGVLLAAGMVRLLRSDLGLSSSSLVVGSATIILALVVGTGITVVSALGPAIRSSRVSPVAAMRDDVVMAESSLRRQAVIGGVFGALGVIALFAGLFGGGGIALVGAGAALTFIGVAVLLPFISGPVARIIGLPLTLAGITGRLGRANAMRNPRRTATTAAALMIGLAVVTAIATLATSATASYGGLYTNTFKAADYAVTASGGNTFPKSIETVVARVPGVTAISPFTEVQFHTGNASHMMAAIDPITGPQLLHIQVVSGSTAALAKGQIMVNTKVAKSDHYVIGSRIAMGFAVTGVHTYTIGGTYQPNAVLDSYLGPTAITTANTTQPADEAIIIKVASPSKAAQAALTAALAPYPEVSVQTEAQYVNTLKKSIAGFLKFVYVLLGLSIVIALIGVVNTLVLSVVERTHELGLLRAVGMLRRQVRSMIRGEAVIVAVLGAVLGLVLGVAFGAALVRALSSQGIGQLAIPVSTIIVILVLAVIFGVLASIFPARRAAKLDVLRAVSTS